MKGVIALLVGSLILGEEVLLRPDSFTANMIEKLIVAVEEREKTDEEEDPPAEEETAPSEEGQTDQEEQTPEEDEDSSKPERDDSFDILG